MKIPYSSVSYIIRKWKTHGTVQNYPGRGRKKKTTTRQDAAILRKVKINPRLSSSKIAAEIGHEHGIVVSARSETDLIRWDYLLKSQRKSRGYPRRTSGNGQHGRRTKLVRLDMYDRAVCQTPGMWLPFSTRGNHGDNSLLRQGRGF